MNIPSYVYQNGFGIYYFRIAIPKHLKPAFRKHEIRTSLKTTNPYCAEHLLKVKKVVPPIIPSVG